MPSRPGRHRDVFPEGNQGDPGPLAVREVLVGNRGYARWLKVAKGGMTLECRKIEADPFRWQVLRTSMTSVLLQLEMELPAAAANFAVMAK